MTFIIDAAKHELVTPANLKKIGAAGAIVYAGCDATWKNVTKPELHACLDAGFSMALVVENFADDLGEGRAEGQRQGANLVAAAKALGYDYENCVLFASADYDTRGATVSVVGGEAMAGFKSEVPVPGIYGNSYLLDYCATNKTADVFWQSESLSFSNGTSPHANFIQIYGDNRNQGLPFDINQVLSTPLRFMGEEDMPLSPADLAAIQEIVNKPLWMAPGHDPKNPHSPDTVIRWAIGDHVDKPLANLGTLETAVQAAVTKLQIGGVDPVALAKEIAAHLTLTAS